MEKQYSPAQIEEKWRQCWDNTGSFGPSGDGEAFSIVLPPPNVTGSLHMGHAFQDTLMDVMTRLHRMQGYSTLWQPGCDHAGIATQMVVERQLNAEGKSRHDLGREAFVDKIWEWKEQSGNQIESQMRTLGTSCDFSRSRFTMDEGLAAYVRDAFIKLFEDGLIYRGQRLVNWDPILKTAVSDLEVEHKESSGTLWHLKYPVADSDEYIVVATTRPETMFGDAAVAVHPDDARYAHLVGKKLQLPLTDRQIPVIADEMVEQDFGSGCVKITPAHDFNDHEVGKRHDLPLMNILNDDATMNNNVPSAFAGMERFAARKAVLEELKNADLLDKEEPYQIKSPHGDRTGALLEPYLTDQWFVKTAALAKDAIKVVETGEIEFIPGNWVKLYNEWMHNIQDWCISRQLWWGHRIPAWYDDEGNIYVGTDEASVREKYSLGDKELKQDEDVMDTWFSSAFWPFSSLGYPNDPVAETHFPTSVLVTGFDIIFFWVARMIMMSLYFTKKVPFKKVYITGLILDPQGQKMSKSKGNVIDPLDIINGISLDDLLVKRTQGMMQPKLKDKITKQTKKEFPNGISSYGTDALRFTLTQLAHPGREIRFDFDRLEGNRHFANKIWNAARFMLSNITEKPSKPDSLPETAQWLMTEYANCYEKVQQHIKEWRYDMVATTLYNFIWQELCDWGLELSKTSFRSDDAAERNAVAYTLVYVLENTMRMLHPIMPFISEEIFEQLKPFTDSNDACLAYANYADKGEKFAAFDDVVWLKSVIGALRSLRSERNLSPAKKLPLVVRGASAQDKELFTRFESYLGDLAKVESVTFSDDKVESAAAKVVGSMTLLVSLVGLIDLDAERMRLDKAMVQVEKDLKVVGGKLSNPGYVAKANPSIVEKDKARLAELESSKEQLLVAIKELG